jgi:hypothetical protein
MISASSSSAYGNSLSRSGSAACSNSHANSIQREVRPSADPALPSVRADAVNSPTVPRARNIERKAFDRDISASIFLRARPGLLAGDASNAHARDEGSFATGNRT